MKTKNKKAVKIKKKIVKPKKKVTRIKKKVVKSKKKIVKSKKPKKPLVKVKKEGKLLGKITHYFSNIKVAVIKLKLPVKKGDKIRIIGGEQTDFEQKISSMQVDYKNVTIAKKGKSIGLEVKEKVHEGYKIYKV